MPLSKNNVLYFTTEQKARADQNSSALDYALSQGYELVREGSYYKMKNHDSMVFKPDGSWFWNSRGLHGRAPEFIMNYEGQSYVEAILKLAGDDVFTPTKPYHPIQRQEPENPPVEFALPEKADSQRQLFAYLCKTRRLSPDVVKEMLRQGILYQTDHRLPSGKTVHNACFVSFDGDGKPCSAFKRGLATEGKPYKREVPGGDKSQGWIFRGNNPEHLYVFEACIDAASYITIQDRVNSRPLENSDYLALGGLNFQPVETYLSRNEKIKCVHLMLDHDSAGQEAAEKFQR